MRRYLVSAIALALATSSLTVLAAAPMMTSASQLATTQLPRGITPTHYDISISPHAQAMNFDGVVTVTLDVLKSTNSITLSGR